MTLNCKEWFNLKKWKKYKFSRQPFTNFAGGEIYDGDRQSSDDVLLYVPETSDWKKIGSMKTARFSHGASLVNMGDVIDYCI